jgi:ATP-binding cassette, subfamily B, multidrug efflux pump
MKNTTKKSDWQLIRGFFAYISPYRKWVTYSLLAVPFSIAATLLNPLLLVKIVDDYLVVAELKGLIFMVSLLAGVVVVNYIADAIYTYNLQRAGQMALADMRKDLYRHSLTLPRKYYDSTPIGVTLSRMTSDGEAIGESVAIGVLSLITDIIKTIALFAFLFYLSWQLSLVILCILPPVYFLVNRLRSKLRGYYNESREGLAAATAYLQECLNGIKTLQLYASEMKTIRLFKQKNRRFLEAQTKSNIYDSLLYSVIEGLTTVTMAGILWIGTGGILKGVVTIGVLVGFINTLNRLFIPIREFAQQISLIQRALSALEHIDRLFAEPSEKTQVTPLVEGDSLSFKTLEFEGVDFAYNEGSQVLDRVCFSLNRGENIAIVGATGSGKSTILRLITKAYANYKGSIRLNGRELREISKTDLFSCTTLMQQDVFLFNESIRFNISLGRAGIGEQEIRAAAEFVYANQFIDRFKEGLDYRIIDNGKNLSAGQAQLISFARAIAGGSDLILLDEATSSVDSVTENLIQKATARIFKEKTVIAIAHRLSTIQHSELILVMKEGRIVEQGNHQELLQQGGYYLQLLKRMEQQEIS